MAHRPTESHPEKDLVMDSDRATRGDAVPSYANARTRTVSAGGVDFAYRELGTGTGVPVVFLTHLAAVLDNWDPRVVDGIAAKHRVITFDNRGVGASSGSTPDTIQAMAEAGVEVESIRESRPTFEDVFTALVERDRDQHGGETAAAEAKDAA
jgi:pimeloyl-ACP methyl ester carboxylesterase